MWRIRTVMSCGAAVLAVLLLAPHPARSGTFLPADVTVTLDAEHAGTEALGAQVDVVLVDPATAVLRLINTSKGDSPIPEGPLLVGVAFNLAGDPGAGCLEAEDPAQRFVLASPAAPLCGGLHRFGYELVAAEAPLWTTEVHEVALRVRPECQGTFAFTHDTFLQAAPATVGASTARFGATLMAVAEEPGPVCLVGTPGLVTPALHFTWATFLVNAAEIRASKSAFSAADPRAGSADIVLAGDVLPGGMESDPPLEAAILTLRNGAGAVLEQQHLNRLWVPHDLDANGCMTTEGPPTCFVSWPEDTLGDVLTASVPSMVENSNEGFDALGRRVTVAATLTMDYTMAPFADASHEVLRVSWTRPGGIARAQLQLRAVYDANLNGSTGDEPLVTLYTRNDPMQPGGVFDPSLRVVHVSANTLAIEVDVQAALESIRAAYVKAGVL